MRAAGRRLALLVTAVLVAGCSPKTPIDDLLEGRKIDYQESESQKQKQLQYPPSVLSTGGSIQATVSLKEYSLEKFRVPEDGEVVPESQANVYYRRDGRLRWVEVDLPADEVWLKVAGFWRDYLGFPLVSEDPDLGIIETDWLEMRTGVLPPGLAGGYLSQFLDNVQDSGERDKFVTRMERNEDGGTDVFVSHRHIVANFDKEGLFSGYERVDGDIELEIEMLRRLMLHFVGLPAEAADGEVRGQIEAAEEKPGSSDYDWEGTRLWINKAFPEAWKLAQIGLDRGGFTVEDRDLQESVIYIRHSGGPDSEKIFGKAETSFFNRLFGEEKPILRDIKLIFDEQKDDRTLLTVEAVEGDDPLTEEQASVVLELLHEYLP